MHVDTGADSTVISSLIWNGLGKPQLNGKVRRLEAYDGHQLTLLGSLTCGIDWKGSKYRKQQLAVVQSDKKFGLLGRNILPQEGINAVNDEILHAVKGHKAHVKLRPGSQPMLYKARKIPLPLPDMVKEKLETMVRQGILEPVQPGGVINASPVVWQRKKMELWDSAWTWKFTSMAKLWTMTIQSQTRRPFSLGPLTLKKLNYQTHIIKMSWTRMQKK